MGVLLCRQTNTRTDIYSTFIVPNSIVVAMASQSVWRRLQTIWMDIYQLV